MKTKYILFIVSVILLTTVLLLSKLYRASEKEVVQQFQVKQQNRIHHLTTMMESFLDKRTKAIKVLSLFPSLQNRELEKMTTDIQTFYELEKINQLKVVSVYDEKGTIIYSTSKKDVGTNYSDLDFFQWAAKKENKGKEFISYQFYRDENKNEPLRNFKLLLAAPIYQRVKVSNNSEQPEKFMGIVTATINFSDIILSFFPLMISKSGMENMYFMDNNGNVLYFLEHPKVAMRNIRSPEETCFKCHYSFDHIKTILAEKDGFITYKLTDKAKGMSSFSSLEFNNILWKIVICIPYEKVSGFIEYNLRITLVLIGIMIFALLGGALLYLRTNRLKIRAEEEAKQWKEKLNLEKELHKSKDSLSKASIQWQTTFDAMKDAVMLLDNDSNVLQINEATTKLLEKTREEILGHKCWEVIHNKNERIDQCTLLKMKQTMEREKTILLSKDKWLEIVVDPIFDKNNVLNGAVHIITDITEKKIAEDYLKSSEERLKILFNNAPDAYYITDLKGNFIDGNIAAEKLLGYTKEELIGSNFLNLKLLSASQLFKAKPLLAKSLIRKPTDPDELVLNRKDGTKVDVEIITNPILIEGQSLVLGTARDISKRKHVEKEIRMLAQSLKSINECISITDLEDKILFVNQSFLNTYGYKEEELIGKHMSIVQSLKNSPEIIRKVLPSTIQGGWHGELLNKRKDGNEFPVYLSTTVITDKDGKTMGLIGVATDITERKKSKQELIIAKEKAEESDKLKTAFLNNISHEIRTPLNGILGFAPFIMQSDISLEEKEQYLNILNTSSSRLLNTITDYLDMSHIVSNSIQPIFRPIDINSFLSKIYEHFQPPCLSKNLEFNIQISDIANVIVKTDEELLRKTISHIVDNAIKFTLKGSVTMGYEYNEGKLKLFVKDTGQGIAQDAQNLVLKNFMQANISNTRGHEGSGLGLSIANNYALLLGGELSIVSEENHGTTIFVTLPFEKDALAEKNHEYLITKNTKKSPCLLVAEDDNLSYLYIKKILKGNISTILRAENGREAVDLCRQHPEISLVLMDIKMSVMDGMEATRIIKSFRKDLTIIAVTAYAQSSDKNKFMEGGCDDYISKPFEKAQLTKLLNKYITI